MLNLNSKTGIFVFSALIIIASLLPGNTFAQTNVFDSATPDCTATRSGFSGDNYIGTCANILDGDSTTSYGRHCSTGGGARCRMIFADSATFVSESDLTNFSVTYDAESRWNALGAGFPDKPVTGSLSLQLFYDGGWHEVAQRNFNITILGVFSQPKTTLSVDGTWGGVTAARAVIDVSCFAGAHSGCNARENIYELGGLGTPSNSSLGNIHIGATLDGALWSGPVNYTVSGPSVSDGTSVPLIIPSKPQGIYTITYNSGGPSNATLSSITPVPSQFLTGGAAVAFSLNFETVSTPAPAPSPQPHPSDYILSANPDTISVNVRGTNPITSTETTIKASSLNNFSGDVGLKVVAVTPVLPGAVFKFIDSPAPNANIFIPENGEATSQFSVIVPPNAQPGAYNITIQGTRGSEPQTNVILNVSVRDSIFREVFRPVQDLLGLLFAR